MRTIERMYEHLNWANNRILSTLQNINDAEQLQELCRLFSHILFAENIWLTRLQGLDSSHLPIFSDISIDACEVLVNQNQKMITIILASLHHDDLDELVNYKNSIGKQFSTSTRDILTHIALHGQYHRGQINLLLRKNNVEPVGVDYIAFVR